MDFYTHGGNIYDCLLDTKTPILDFSANINPMGLPEQIKQAVINSLTVCAHYPDPYCRELTAALSDHYHINREHIICGNGAADLITRFALAQKPKNALLLAPTFSEYEHALTLVDCTITYLNLQAETDFSLTTELFYEEMLSALTPNLDVLFLCNPNNPTGQVIPTNLLKKILNVCKQYHITLFLDECFLPFVTDNSTQSLLPECAAYSNLFLLRAFTKQYAMAGIRLGFGVCSNKILLQQMFHCGQPWSVSIPAQHAGIAALQCNDYWAQSLTLIDTERAFLIQELKKRNMNIIPSKANYILFYSSIPLEQKLKEYNILIRNCENYRGLTKGYYRIAVRTHNENAILLHAIDRILQEV